MKSIILSCLLLATVSLQAQEFTPEAIKEAIDDAQSLSPSGKGTLTLRSTAASSGVSYEGEYVSNAFTIAFAEKLYAGEITGKFDDAYTYRIDDKGRVPHGQGKISFGDEGYIEGTFVLGWLHGYGTKFLQNIPDANYETQKMTGKHWYHMLQGESEKIYTYENGLTAVYTGEMIDDNWQGWVKKTLENPNPAEGEITKVVYKYYYKDGVRKDFEIVHNYYPDGYEENYMGNTLDGERHGEWIGKASKNGSEQYVKMTYENGEMIGEAEEIDSIDYKVAAYELRVAAME